MALRHATGHAGNEPGQGPFLRISLAVESELIRQATYETYQCPGCVACGQAIVAMVLGRTIHEAEAIKHDDVVARVGPLAPHRRICYGLAVLALSDVVAKIRANPAP